MKDWKEARVSFLPFNRLTSQPIPHPCLVEEEIRLFMFSSSITKISHPILTSTETAALAQNVLPLSSLILGEGQSPMVLHPGPDCLLEGLFPPLMVSA